MATRWVLVILLIFTLIEAVRLELYDEFSMLSSLGYTEKSPTLDDDSQLRRYQEMYEEMLKASRESFERIGEEEARLEAVVGWQRAKSMKRGVIDQRRQAADMRSPVRRRRERSQLTRREKLASQGLRNHQRHVRLMEKDTLDTQLM